MSNEPTGAITKEVAFDIKALLLGNAPSKSSSVIKTKDVLKDSGNTNKTPDDPEKLKNSVLEAVDYFDRVLQHNQFNLKFSVDDKSNSVIVQVLEKGTDKVIRQIPPEEVLRLRQRIRDLLGMIYDKEM